MKKKQVLKNKGTKATNKEIFTDQTGTDTNPVTCLGMKFDNDEARRTYFTDILRKKLKDPEFRKIEGFPIGEDEDILALSDPPYYTACPNPWLKDFIEEWEAQKPEKPEDYKYHREPFAADVSEGKNDPIYNAHSYHTKVPHKAIMRYILHYTEPGDIVFDGFCGTGMTGVAAQMCGDKAAVESLGVTKKSPEQQYKVQNDGIILERQLDDQGKTFWKPFSKFGARKAVLNDLSPAATFITSNYNKKTDPNLFEKRATAILEESNREFAWMYMTLHNPSTTQIEESIIILKNEGKTIANYKNNFSWGSIRFIVWSEFIRCNVCGEENSYWDLAVDKKTRYKKKVTELIECPNCTSTALFKEWDKVLTTVYDPKLRKSTLQPKQTIVLINYNYGSKNYDKTPDHFDKELISYIQKGEVERWYPSEKMLFKGKKWGDTWRSGVHTGLENVHQFYFDRSLHLVSFLNYKAYKTPISTKDSILYWIQSVCLGFTKLNRYLEASYSQVNRYLKGTLYVARFTTEVSAPYALKGKIKKIKKIMGFGGGSVTTTESASNISGKKESLDYIFLDPPFGGNIMYSELNFIWESWLKVVTNAKEEAIENVTQNKTLIEYQTLITSCFEKFYFLLKPSRWITVEFHNSKNRVWNCIQSAIQKAGFVIADVRILDKKQMTMQQMTSRGAVKQDLVISAYKPNTNLLKRMQLSSGQEDNVWDFIRSHLKQLPIFVSNKNKIELIVERQHFLLFDRMIAFHVQHNIFIPISATEFYNGLSQRFSVRDGMYFLPEQVAEYDRKKMIGGGRPIQQSMFVSDESSAIEWLRNMLRDKPQTFQDLNPQFMKEISGWSKNEKPLELSTLLDQNFLCYDGQSTVPEQIHSYLSTNWKDMRNRTKEDKALMTKAKDRWYVPDPNKAGDLEKLRDKSLMKEFEQYRLATKKLKLFRLEAVRAGFKKAWQKKEYDTIISVAEKIPNKILEEDPKLLMWYDQAITRTGDQ
ncbi:MAG: DNA methylase [Candidatus Cloacimonadota bacterium]|nr:MAG: DNA methylase [Candidatus Cloacimonadota bacterium]